MYISLYLCDFMARQISVSDSVYNMLLKNKGKKSFSEVIIETFQNQEKNKKDITIFAGVLKQSKKDLSLLEKEILNQRRNNKMRNLKW